MTGALPWEMKWNIEAPPAAAEAKPWEVDWTGGGAPQNIPVPPEKPAPPLLDTVKQAIGNIPASALQFGKDVIQPILHPIDTAVGLKDLGLGIIQKIRNLSPEHLRGTAPAFDESMADAVGKHFSERYGDWDNIQKTIAKDPVGSAADLSVIMTGGGTAASKLPGVAGKAGSIVAETGRAVDPVNVASKAVTLPLKAAEPVVSNAIGLTTGAGPAPLREAAAAGREGGPRQDALIGQMRGKEPVANVVDAARAAIDEMRAQRGDAYRKGMAGVTKDPTILDFKPIDDALSKVAEVGTFKGQSIKDSAVETWGKINAAVDAWRKLDPAQFHTVEGLDALKKKLGDIRDGTKFDDPARVVADEVYRAVRKQIADQAPSYGKIMRGYEEASAALRELERSLSLGEKASIDTTVRKLQSVMRNNANTNYGQRVQQAQTLAASGGDTLFPQIAGQALSSPTPRGMQGVGATLGAMGAAAMDPTFLLGLPLSSPRIMGEGALKLGQAARGADVASPLINALLGPLTNYPARMAGYEFTRAQQDRK